MVDPERFGSVLNPPSRRRWWVWAAILSLVAILCLWLWQRSRRSEDEAPPRAMVLLLGERREITDRELARLFSNALDVDLNAEDADATEFVVGEPPTFVVKFQGYVFLVHTFPRPYWDDPCAVASKVWEVRAADAVRRHRAWLSVDLVQTPPGADAREGYRHMGRMVAALAGPSTLAVFSTETERINLYDAELGERLQTAKDPLKELEEPTRAPIVNVPAEDPKMTAAIAEARRRWPEFVKAFATREPNEPFLVKARFTHGDNVEHMWVKVEAIEEDVIRGLLGNEPLDIPHLKQGDPVTVKRADLSDWIFPRDGNAVGGFTLKALKGHVK